VITFECPEGSPANKIVSQNAKGIMSRSQNHHRYIGGYALVSISAAAAVKAVTDIASLLHRIRSKTFRNRIRIKDFFEQHDRMRTRKVTGVRF